MTKDQPPATRSRAWGRLPLMAERSCVSKLKVVIDGLLTRFE